ncbi:hypothetical protein [Geomonas propionica]|uniref:Uncharacterized protein n=1 Tax=Geomonas propionica TaxID=2798582 RepID=A0ABS0YVU9_9BACT|nr:hypothetical protein [Geomonas propionica]MBJ6802076.1 hypothetical protein [Geomonas propionica]
MERGWKKTLLWVGAVVVVALVVVKIIDVQRRPKQVASILNIPSLPTSVRVVDCKDEPIPTDVVVGCSIEMDPRDLPNLLRGYKFTETAVNETSHTAILTKVGPEFPVTSEFVVEPKEFKNGGHVKVCTDRERKRAVIDLYIE